jgi:hypothetical protein
MASILGNRADLKDSVMKIIPCSHILGSSFLIHATYKAQLAYLRSYAVMWLCGYVAISQMIYKTFIATLKTA